MHKKLPPEQRKKQIIFTALQLFAKNGYEHTSVNHIIDAAGISKGGFYHHYASKEELLEDIVGMMIGDMVAVFSDIDASPDLSALDKTNEYIRRVNELKEGRVVEAAALMSELYSDGKNVLLEKKLYDYAVASIGPVMKRIVRQGADEGTFQTAFPEEAAELYVKLFIMMQQEMSDLFHEALIGDTTEILVLIKRKYSLFQQLMENTLGLKEDSLVIREVMGKTAERLCLEILALQQQNRSENE